jgi:hypothetical protein
MSATRCFSCIAFPFPRVVLGSKNIRASKAAPVKSQRSPARATNPGRATTPVPAASCRPFSALVLTSYLEGQCRLLYYCNTHFKNFAYGKLGNGLPLFTELPSASICWRRYRLDQHHRLRPRRRHLPLRRPGGQPVDRRDLRPRVAARSPPSGEQGSPVVT